MWYTDNVLKTKYIINRNHLTNYTLIDYVVPACLPLIPEQQMGFSAEQFHGKEGRAAGFGSVTGGR